MNCASSGFPANAPLLKENEVHVWRCDLDAPALADCEKNLCDAERARASSFHFPLHRARYIAGRSALRNLISLYLHRAPEIFRFQTNAHGKPELENSRLRFNVSHSQNWALLAFCWIYDVGVDIEYCRDDWGDEKIARLADRFFCEAESRQLNSLQSRAKRDAFFRCWTRKEALLKATGEGIAGGLKKFQVSLLPGAAPGVLAPPADVNAWSLRDVNAPENFFATLAVRAPGIAVRCVEL